MQNAIGIPARGNKFYPRTAIVKRILDRISSGQHLQIAAPRRIGKTSILYHLLDNPVNGFHYIFVDTESHHTAGDFYKKILQAILKHPKIGSSKKILSALTQKTNQFLTKIKGIKILGNSIDLHEDKTAINHYEDFCNLLYGYAQEEKTKLIIMVDEFPQTVQNIANADPEKGTANALEFLQENRSLRIHPDLLEKVVFIYTGSIGLTYTVSAMGGSAFINDLNTIEISALSQAEALDLLQKLLAHYSLAITSEAAHYLLDKIEWLIPFHIQLAVQEIEMIAEPRSNITAKIIDQAFETIIASRNNNHFEHYFSRLKTHFKGQELLFAQQVLQQIAAQKNLGKEDIYDCAVTFNLSERCKGILEALVYDGYINNNENHHIYRFNSPIVRLCWQKNICK